MTHTESKTALVTGASAGIGLDYADFLAERGWNLVLTARRTERLEAAAERIQKAHNVTCTIITADLACRDAPVMIMDALNTKDIHIDALINNAGYALATSFARTDWDDIQDFLQVMVGAVTHLPHLVLPGMQRKGYGRIVNIASLAAFAPEPIGSLYPSVKRYMVSMSRAIHVETRGTGVHCVATCPGFTWTEFHDVLGMRKEVSSVPKILWQNARAVVKESWKAAEKNRAVHVTGIPNKILHGLCWLTPHRLAHGMMPKGVKNRGRHREDLEK